MKKGRMGGRPPKRRVEYRRMVLARDPLCKICGERASVEADHIVPLARGGLDDPSNMRGVCKGCHVKKTKSDWAVKKTVDVNGNEIEDVVNKKRWGRWSRKRGRPPMLYGEKQ